MPVRASRTSLRVAQKFSESWHGEGFYRVSVIPLPDVLASVERLEDGNGRLWEMLLASGRMGPGGLQDDRPKRVRDPVSLG